MNLQRWTALMSSFGVAGNPEMFERITKAYAEPHRRYHTAAHIDACLREFDSVRSLARSGSEVESALWFHDVIYNTRASDNELQSAEMASRFLASSGVSPSICARVHSHILATAHKGKPDDDDARLVVDIDLSILGQDEQVYGLFERSVREEYKWVPWFLFRRKRIEILRSFLDRESIYGTEQFRQRYESAARSNLERAIRGLENDG
jgi:predicted metal-dependent HD superfamily phosphohydrolase